MRARGSASTSLRVLLVLGFIVAAGATALVIVAKDVQWLRLATVLALWAALIAAFAVTRSRRDAKAAATREKEAHLAYQVELHREVSARHEYEAELAAQMAAAQSEQIAELREQLDRLTEVLTALTDGEVLVSRMTLSAESARFRAGQSLAAGPVPVALAGDRTRAIEWVEPEPVAERLVEPAARVAGPSAAGGPFAPQSAATAAVPAPAEPVLESAAEPVVEPAAGPERPAEPEPQVAAGLRVQPEPEHDVAVEPRREPDDTPQRESVFAPWVRPAAPTDPVEEPLEAASVPDATTAEPRPVESTAPVEPERIATAAEPPFPSPVPLVGAADLLAPIDGPAAPHDEPAASGVPGGPVEGPETAPAPRRSRHAVADDDDDGTAGSGATPWWRTAVAERESAASTDQHGHHEPSPLPTPDPVPRPFSPEPLPAPVPAPAPADPAPEPPMPEPVRWDSHAAAVGDSAAEPDRAEPDRAEPAPAAPAWAPVAQPVWYQPSVTEPPRPAAYQPAASYGPAAANAAPSTVESADGEVSPEDLLAAYGLTAAPRRRRRD